jgi:hypothetical protein
MKNSARFQCDVPYPRLLLPQQLALAEPRAKWTCFWGLLEEITLALECLILKYPILRIGDPCFRNRSRL